MNSDPIVEETRAVRDRLAAEYGYDVSRIFADIRSREHLLGERLKNRQKSQSKTMHPNCDSAISKNDSAPTAG